QPCRRWDSRDHAFRTPYDALRRPIGSFVTAGSTPEVLLTFTRYGEEAPQAKARYLFGQPWRAYGTDGLVTTEAVDVDGNVTESTRRFVARYFPLPDWTEHHDDPGGATDTDWVQTADDSARKTYTLQAFSTISVWT